MTAQIISFTEKREAIRLKRYADESASGFLLPGVIFGCAMFWIVVGVAVYRAWPLVRLS